VGTAAVERPTIVPYIVPPRAADDPWLNRFMMHRIPNARRVSMTIPLRTVLVLLVLLAAAPPGDVHADGLLQALQTQSRPLRGEADLDPLIDAAGAAGVVLLGEASHGTHEFYVWRDRLTRRLITELGFDFIAIEGDWASLLPLDRYVRHHPDAPASR